MNSVNDSEDRDDGLRHVIGKCLIIIGSTLIIGLISLSLAKSGIAYLLGVSIGETDYLVYSNAQFVGLCFILLGLLVGFASYALGKDTDWIFKMSPYLSK